MHTAFDHIRFAVDRSPSRLAIVDDRTARKLTYRQLLDEVEAIAAGLFQRGVRPRDRVAVSLPNTYEHALILLALQRLDAVAALMNFRLPAAQIGALVKDGGITSAIIGANPELVEEVAKSLPAGGALFAVGDPGCENALARCSAPVASLPTRQAPRPDDAAFIFYTSGTTGDPKGVLIPHSSIQSRLICLAPQIGLQCGRELRTLGVAPLFHAIGFFAVFMQTIAFGGTYYVHSVFDPKAVLDQVERHRISYLFLVPTMFQAVVADPTYRPQKLKSLTTLAYGGSTMSRQLLGQLRRDCKASMFNLYGSTEMMAPFYNRAPFEAPTMFDMAIHHRVRIVRANGAAADEVGVGETGEIIVDAASPSMFSGYLNAPETNAAKLREGWFHTGDLAVRCPDDRIELVGRADDVIRTGAESVYPEEIERLLGALPGVREACVVGAPDAYWGEIVVACIAADVELTLDQVRQHLSDAGLAKFKMPKAIVRVARLPRNAASKILRKQVRQTVIGALMSEAGSDQAVA